MTVYNLQQVTPFHNDTEAVEAVSAAQDVNSEWTYSIQEHYGAFFVRVLDEDGEIIGSL